MIVPDNFRLPAEKIRHILIIQLGDIGDVVWTIPSLLSVRAAYPEAKLSILVREMCAELLQAEPYLHRIFQVRSYPGGLFEKTKEQIRFIADLRREQIDLAIDLRSGDRGAFAAWLTGAPLRASLLYRDVSIWRNFVFNRLVRPVNENIRLTYGAAEQSLRIIRGIGIPAVTDIPVLHVADKAIISAIQLLKRLVPAWGNDIRLQDRFVTLNPFSRWPYKEWDIDRWLPVAEALFAECGLITVVIGSASEKSRAQDLVDKTAGMVFNAAGETTLAALAALLSLSRLHMGVDSAAPHIAAAVGIPTVTIYGPSDWRDWAPVGKKHRVISSDMSCAPCHRKGCDGQGFSRCLEDLSAETVKKVILSAVLPHQPA